MEENIGHLQTKVGYKQAYGWKFIQVFIRRTEDRQTDGCNLDPLVSLHLGGLGKNGYSLIIWKFMNK